MTQEQSSLLQITFGRLGITRRIERITHRICSRASQMTVLRGFAILTLFSTSPALLAQSSAQKTLDRFKSMGGTWEGKSPSGGTSEVTYRLAAGGTAVMADMHMAGDDMMSMYYVDGDQLLMTHFCPTGNQPRMKAIISSDLNTVTFDFLDATNLAGPQTGHMHRAVFLFSDAGHYNEEWTWKQEGKDTKMYFEMQRKK
jgi:hypothetical protein